MVKVVDAGGGGGGGGGEGGGGVGGGDGGGVSVGGVVVVWWWRWWCGGGGGLVVVVLLEDMDVTDCVSSRGSMELLKPPPIQVYSLLLWGAEIGVHCTPTVPPLYPHCTLTVPPLYPTVPSLYPWDLKITRTRPTEGMKCVK